MTAVPAFRRLIRALPATLALAGAILLQASAAWAQQEDAGDSDFDRFLARSQAQAEGIRTTWHGEVVGDLTRRIGGQARLNFVEAQGGRLVVAFWLGESHAYYDGVHVAGTVSCARGTRTYPVWVRRSAGENRPFGRMDLSYTDAQATVSNRAGVWPPASDDIYEAEHGRITLTLLQDRLAVAVEAVLDAGPIHSQQPPYTASARVRLRASAEVERTLENERLFDTSRCEGRVPFEVVSVKPTDGRANVLEADPEILVELSEDVHPESLQNPDLIVVRTLRRAPGAQPDPAVDESRREATAGNPLTSVPFALAGEHTLEERVPGQVDLAESNVLRFVPDAPLRSGVRYQIDLAHGDGGIRSQEFHVLEEQWPTWFTTRVKPDEVRVNVYQTTRDAPLVLRKPALARVYVDWDEDLDIVPDWQAQEAEFDIELTRNDQRRAVLPGETHWVGRPDLYDDEDRRLARDSVNRFGWTPRGKDVRHVVARVRPHDPYPARNEREVPEDTGSSEVRYLDQQVDDLTVEAWILKLGSWREQPPGPDIVGAVTRGFQLDNEYARQVYPVVAVRGYLVGMMDAPYVPLRSADDVYRGSLSPGLKFDFDQVARNYATLEVQSRILHDHFAVHSAADIVVGYYPPELGDGRGQGILDYPSQRANVVLMPVADTDWSAGPAMLVAPLVAHEYGHVFGLRHRPDVTGSGRAVVCGSKASYLQPSAGIEGFRILAGGMGGHSKSSTTGNGEEAESLKDLMFPCQYDPRAMWWITDADYRRLVVTLPMMLQGQRADRFAGLQPQGASDISHAVQMHRPVPAKPEGLRWMLVSGFTDGEGTLFFPAVDVPSPQTGPEPDSPYSLVVESTDGRPLASRRVVRLGDEGPGYFSATLEVREPPGRVLLLKDGQRIGELAAGTPPVAPRIVSHEEGDFLGTGATLRWRPVDDAPSLYSVRYHAGPAGPTRVLAALTEKTELAIDPASLPHGEAPQIEVLVHSGLHEAGTRLRVQLPDALRPMLVHPVGEMAANDEAGIGAWFATDLAPDSLHEGVLRLIAADGSQVPARSFVDPNGSGVRLVPDSPLEPDAQYAVHLSPGLAASDGRVVRSAARWEFTTSAVGADAATASRLSRQRPLARAVTPLSPPASQGRSVVEPKGAAAGRASGEATVVGATATPRPVTLTVCQPISNPGARVLFAGSFAGGRFSLERSAGDDLLLDIELETDAGPLATRLQGSLERLGGNGLTLREQHGHWTVIALVDLDGQRHPVMMTLDCGLR